MNILKRWGLGALVVAASVAIASCNELAGPSRPAGYAYTLVVTDSVRATDTIDGVIYTKGTWVTDTVDFKWPLRYSPIRIWVEDTIGLPQYMAAAIATWKGILIYGEWDATLTSDSSAADIIVRDAPAPPSMTAVDGPERVPPVAACEGETDIRVRAPDHRGLYVPIRMYILPKYALTDTLTPPCLARVAIHELGHALGLFQHSPNPDDIMAQFPVVDRPSDADIATILWVYHQPTRLLPDTGTPKVYPPDTTTPPDTTPDTVLASRPRLTTTSAIDPIALLTGH